MFSSWQLNWRIAQLRWSLHYRGLGMTTLSFIANAMAWTDRDWYWQYKERHFDRRHCVDTQGLIPIEQLDVSARDQSRGWGYMATQPEWFHSILSKLDISFGDYTFVDFGSGKGRTLLLAASRPFKQIIGVEYSQKLHAVATRNITMWQQWRACRDLRPVLADAACFELPLTPLVVYMYNPFKEEVLRDVLANIQGSYQCAPRHMMLIYANPTCKALVDQCSDWEPVMDNDGDPAIAVYEIGR